MILLENSN
jgi:hypothetical protein